MLFFACKDKTTDPPPATPVDCSTKTILLTATVTAASKCSSNGKLVARATGSSGFTFQLNSGAFQSDSTFNNLAVGSYDITAKDKDGCTKKTSFTVSENGTKGPTFTAVAAIIGSKCQGGFCHSKVSSGAPINNMNTDCKIVALSARIKLKAVDEGMGSLSQGDKDKITAWIAAGGKLTD